jgi:hypothetical protein
MRRLQNANKKQELRENVWMDALQKLNVWMDALGIDPNTSRMRSGRSTI